MNFACLMLKYLSLFLGGWGEGCQEGFIPFRVHHGIHFFVHPCNVFLHRNKLSKIEIIKWCGEVYKIFHLFHAILSSHSLISKIYLFVFKTSSPLF